jgi:hypothetical protein
LISSRPTPLSDASSLRRLCDLRRRYGAEHDDLLGLLEQTRQHLERCLAMRRHLCVEGATSADLDERCASAQADVVFLEQDLVDLRGALVGLDEEIEAIEAIEEREADDPNTGRR